MSSELDAYKQAYQREREARLLAEQLLDEKSRQLYESVQTLEHTAQELTKRNLELESTHQQLIRSEKLASIGQLAAGVAHEINNPVGFVLSNMETLQDYFESMTTILTLSIKLSESLESSQLTQEQTAQKTEIKSQEDTEEIHYLIEDMQEIFSDSKHGLERVRDIVAGLKTFAHAGGQELELLDVNECLTNTLKLVNNEIKYAAEVKTFLGDVPKIHGNSGELTQVFTNLIVNAGHACEQGGSITLQTQSDTTNVTITIRDNGCGIAADKLNKIFDPFFTTKPVGKGTGLGLSISQSIVEKHFGTLTAQSTVGIGTTFTIQLPLTPPTIDV